MKFGWLFLSFLCVSAATAEKDKAGLPTGYVVVSDTYNVDVPAGQCVVAGQVLDMNDTPIAGARISTLDAAHQAFTDSAGFYRLVIDSKDTTIYMFYAGLEEIILWNYKFQSQHLVRIDFYPGASAFYIDVAKPVIYLYSEHELNVDINFSCIGATTFTYPKYDDNWEVSLKDNIITDRNTGKTYPYLFWESRTQHMAFEESSEGLEGFVVDTDTAVSFLENSLNALGLTSTEQADFITYWGPKLVQSEYVFIQFWLDDRYDEKISQLAITPTPGALRRVFMAYAPLETTVVPAPVKPQKLENFERKSFTVVEWGGGELRPPVLTP
jgi:hypothetical protein